MKTFTVQAEARPEQPTAVVRATLPVSEIGPWLAEQYQRIAALCSTGQSCPIGPPFARYHRRSDDRFDVEAGFPVGRRFVDEEDVHGSVLPEARVAFLVHVGPYDEMEPAYAALHAWIVDHGGEPVGDPWETYFSDPSTEPDPSTWRTEITQPYRSV